MSAPTLIRDVSGGALVWIVLTVISGLASASSTETNEVHGLTAPVEIGFDAYDIPRIEGRTIEDTLCSLGYLHASERMWQMELFRRLASGRLAELQGEDGLASDILMRRLGIRRSSQAALDEDVLGEDVERWLEAYAAGVNARMLRYREEGWPLPFRAAGLEPEPWAPVDSVSWMKYMGWDQGGTRDDLWLGMMTEKLGAQTVSELWPLDRPYEVTTIPAAGAEGETRGQHPAGARAVVPSADLGAYGSLKWIDDSGSLGRHLTAAQQERPEWMPPIGSFGSNNWVVSPEKSATGHALFANDPHLGFNIPMLWYAAHLKAPGLNVTGVTFPGVPFVIIGHNEHIAWGFTNLQADAVDYFIETLDAEESPESYLHRGEWKSLDIREEVIHVAGREAPLRLTVRSTVHGPLEPVGEQKIALQWAGLGVTREARGLAMLNFAEGLDDFRDALALIDVPALNVAYADREGNIAMAPWGRLPIRAKGRGRVPVDGSSGEFDWVGWIERDDLPFALNPDQGYLASANGRPTPVGYPHHLGWMWDPSYRSRRIGELLASSDSISFEDMKRFQFDHFDKAAEVFLPIMLGALEALRAGGTDIAAFSPTLDAALEELLAWDYFCTPDSTGTTIFARWFDRYRASVWDDEWQSRDIEQPDGSWGFTGDNRREPVLEVLEYMTRENPDSVWFDNRLTPERETRDDLLRASFEEAVESLVEELGPDPRDWRWGSVNRLTLEPLVPTALARRGGQELYGGPFTLNPGSDGKPVSGGASWRQVVEFSIPIRSAGVYPGGQSGHFAHAHYDDLVLLWTSGDYVDLDFAGLRDESAPRRSLTLEPASGP